MAHTCAWTAFTKDGKRYYVNFATKETAWSLPSSSTPAPAPAPSSSSSSSLPAGWEARYDSSSGKSFYINHNTRTTQWEKPTDPAAAAPAPAYAPAPAPAPASAPYTPTQSYAPTTNSSYKPTSSYSPRNNASSAPASTFTLIPAADFTTVMIPDNTFPTCQSCNEPFNATLRRRHHCRLCGNLFCADCSNAKTLLPLPGKEFASPVRVCKSCKSCADAGEYFSPRRYFAVISQQKPDIAPLCAALSAITVDLTQLLKSGGSLEELNVPTDR